MLVALTHADTKVMISRLRDGMSCSSGRVKVYQSSTTTFLYATPLVLINRPKDELTIETREKVSTQSDTRE